MFNVRQMRERGMRPRVHGNGFIQIDLDHANRLHIWGHPDIPRQKTLTPIHDHIFGFTSTVLVGRLMNVEYKVEDDVRGGFRVYNAEVRKDEDTSLTPTPRRVTPHPVRVGFHTKAGTFKYNMKPFVFHETFATELTATMILKDSPTQAQGATHAPPRILVPWDVDPDNTFDRYGHDENLLWEITSEVLNLIK